MAMLNRFTGIGRIGNEPDFKMTNEGTAYLRFSLAIDLKKPSKKNEQKKDTKPEKRSQHLEKNDRLKK